jgi:hypothetical protein
MLAPDPVAAFVTRLEALGVPYMLTGSIAGILYGEPRMTHDVDIVMALPVRDAGRLVAAFPDDAFYCPPEDIVATEARRTQRGHFNLIDHATGFKADIYLAFDELHRWGLAARRRLPLGELVASVAPPEYVIVRKLQYWREGGSAKHRRDIEAMLEVSGSDIDLAAVADWARRLGVEDLWRDVAPP